ncbi:MAG TPA: amidohydrolase family protein [Acidimicrobiales bacterium]|jgi:predicted amidohydrolase YtcJ|nr:amidohydrolase family protein [Acidimicrobiales bacterium]
MPVLIRDGQIHGTGQADVRIEGGRIIEIGPHLGATSGDDIVEADGGAVIPGLHDHHLHLRAQAAAADSVPAGPPDTPTAQAFGDRLRSAAVTREPDQWVRAVGYHQSVAGDLDRWSLDALLSSHPVRVQHRSGAEWIVNSAGLEALGIDDDAPAGVERGADGQPTGRIWRQDAWLATRIASPPPDFGSISRQAASRGITGFTDATPDQEAGDLEALAELSDAGVIRQRLHLMAPVGVCFRDSKLVTRGPVKVLLDDTTLPTLDQLTGQIRDVHSAGRSVAVHCVTRVQAVLTVTALGEAGTLAGDRIEHGSVLGIDLLPVLRKLGITVVTQPGFVFTRGDEYLTDVDPADLGDLWRLSSLVSAGVAVAGSTDAPFGAFNPWAAIRTATTRRTATGQWLGPDERMTAIQGLDLFLGSADRPALRRPVEVGAVADLCVLAEPLATVLARHVDPVVLATVVDGSVIHRAES